MLHPVKRKAQETSHLSSERCCSGLWLSILDSVIGFALLVLAMSEAQPQCNYIAELLEQRAQGEEGLQAHVAVYERAILGPSVEGDPNFSPILPFPAGVCEFIEGH